MDHQKAAIHGFRVLVLVACATPALWLVWAWFNAELGANPAEAVVHFTGRFGLALLLATIALGPAFRLSGWVGFMVARRQLGLWAFVWLVAHALAWMGLDQYWDWPWIWQDLWGLEYIRYGLAGLVLLVPLALTSFRATQLALGRTRWQWLHRLVYLSAALGVVHFWILTRADYRDVVIYGAVLAALAAFRLGCAVVDRR
ncbi:sulfite oxidase heme-binding subunit YedZ [Alkalilimnicola ehrlichii]|uniref:sulfite oxidase heme-binding subunit YedZ n=1 Tax=Alkalilimnicola ehrlichii TaxID=351052 RepID=UPI003BA2EB2E